MLRHRLRSSILIATGLSACLLPACSPRAPDGPPHSVPSYAVRDRVDRVEVGQSWAGARAVLGRDPVRKPNHPESPFPTPLRALELRAPDGRTVRVETYVVAARPARDCPDYQYDDVPIVFIDGVVAGKGWEFLEGSWRGWGGSLAALRAVRQPPRCAEGDGDR